MRAAALIGVLLAGLVPASASASMTPTARSSAVARVLADVTARRAPDPSSPAMLRLRSVTPWSGASLRLMVLDGRYDQDGRQWLKVAIGRRPNGTTAWIPADLTQVTRTPWRIVIRRASRTVRVYRAGKLQRTFRAVIGAPGTPTPTGRFAVLDTVRQADPGAFIGPWALHLTAFSDVLDNYGGGPGRVAIHGRSGASLSDPLGSARSHGCVRINNRQVRFLAQVARPGTPVIIKAR